MFQEQLHITPRSKKSSVFGQSQRRQTTLYIIWRIAESHIRSVHLQNKESISVTKETNDDVVSPEKAQTPTINPVGGAA
jgi:hypothetical protein